MRATRKGSDGKARLLQGAGRQPRRLRGGHQEGLSQARDEAPSGPQSGRQGRRGEIQGGEGSLRGPHRRQEARGLRPVRPRRRRSVGGLRRRRPRGAEGFGGFSDAFGDIFGEIFGAQRGGARQRRLSRRRPALQPRAHARAGGARHRDQDPHPDDGGVRDLPRQRRQARHAAEDLPDLPRPRRGARVAGLLLDPADLPDVPRHRQGRSPTRARPATARAASRSTRRCR